MEAAFNTLLSSTGCEVMEPGPGEGMSYSRAGRHQGTVCSGVLLSSRKPRDALHPSHAAIRKWADAYMNRKNVLFPIRTEHGSCDLNAHFMA